MRFGSTIFLIQKGIDCENFLLIPTLFRKNEIVIMLLLNRHKSLEKLYASVTKEGVTQYVGITNNLAKRAVQHLASKGIKIVLQHRIHLTELKYKKGMNLKSIGYK
jgi:GIY-YIG catalytic domain-containing protein